MKIKNAVSEVSGKHIKFGTGAVIVIALAAIALLARATLAATTIGTNFSTTGNFSVGDGSPTVTLNGEDAYIEGTFEVDGASRFDGGITALLQSASDSAINSTATLVDDSDGDTVAAFTATANNVGGSGTGDGDVIAGIVVNDLASPDNVSTIAPSQFATQPAEIGIYQKGTNWDFGLFTSDTVFHNLPADGFVFIYANDSNGGANHNANVAALKMDIDSVDIKGQQLDFTIADDADATDTSEGIKMSIVNESGDADKVRAYETNYISQVTSPLHADSALDWFDISGSAFTFPKGIHFAVSSSAVLTTAFSASDSDIVNALDAGDNRIIVSNITTSPAAGSCGSGPSVAGSDLAGAVTIGTGSTTACTLTFTAAYGTAPFCVVSGSDAAVRYASTATTAELSITSSADMASDVVNYICIGR